MADVPGDSTTGATIAVGSSLTSEIDVVGDHDWYRVSLTAGQKVVIAVNLLTLEDSYIYLRNASGAVIVENDDGGGGRGSRLIYTAPTTGDYFIDVSAWVNDGTDTDYIATGAYKLSVSNFVMPTVGTLDQFAQQMTHDFFGGDYHHFDVVQGGTITVNFEKITDAGKAVALAALQQWTDIIGVNFVEVTGDAQMMFDDLDQGTGAFANTDHENHITTSATVNVATYRINLHTYMHEIGHALGIGHTSNSNAGTAAAIYPDDAIWSNDGAAISIMSYFDNGENTYYSSQGFSNVAIQTPQVADIIAMGNLYGLSTTTRLGDTTYGFNNTSGRVAFDAVQKPNVSYTILDSGGIDTLDYSGFANNQFINLNPEAFSNVGALIGNVVIARGTTIENAIGGSGNDTLIGNAAANILRGNGGSDAMTGGGGADSFAGTSAQLNGDTITDFSIGDRIVFSDASYANFNFQMSGNTLAYTGGSLLLAGGLTGALSASVAPGGGVQLAFAVLDDPRTDYNGDGRSDVLWRHDDGLVMQWLGQANGSFAYNPAISYQLPLDWSYAAAGDFNGDLRDDVLWRNGAGSLIEWLGQADGSFANNEGAAVSPGVGWQVAGSGDFNGDQFDDVLFRSSAGVFTYWTGSASGVLSPGAATYALGTEWQASATGDFNGDNRDDLVLRHSSGQVIEWLGQGDGGFAYNPAIAYALPTDWVFAGSGDFNNDNRDDTLWRNGDGTLIEWLGQTNGTFAYNAAAVYDMPGDWHVAGTGDLNGDHHDDVMWRSDTGIFTTWLGQSNGSFAASFASYAMPAQWNVQPELMI